jgi:general secretion pathway protein A
MYLRYYGLRREAFHVTPDSSMFYMSPGHREALAAMVYGVQKGLGLIVLTGEVGTGKTTVTRAYLARTRRDEHRQILFVNPCMSFPSLLRSVLAEYNLDGRGSSERRMLAALTRLLTQDFTAGKRVVIILEEAQNIPIETMQKLHLLSNLESESAKLLQIVLVGQPELNEILEDHSLRQLRQRIAVRGTLKPFSSQESIEYIRYRIGQAGGDPDTVFTNRAVRAVARAAKGVPRTINIFCDNALVTGMGRRQMPVNHVTVREVIRDFSGNGTSVLRRRSRKAFATMLFAAAAFGVEVVGIEARGTAAAQSTQSLAGHTDTVCGYGWDLEVTG